jgi:hypothetical protein
MPDATTHHAGSFRFSRRHPHLVHCHAVHKLLDDQRGPGWVEEVCDVLETIAIILIVLWLLGMVSGYTLGNFIWVLLVIAVVLFLVRLVSGRRVV